MKTTRYIFGIMLSSFCMAGCSSDDEELSSAYLSDPNAVIVNATIGSQTRVNTEGTGDTWESGDQICVTNASGNAAKGKKMAVYKYSSNSTWDLQGSDYMAWADGDSEGRNTFHAYYPYDASKTTNSYSEFTIPDDQSSTEKLKSADWMTAEEITTKPTDRSISLTFAHKLAMVTVVINNDVYGNQYSSMPTLADPKITDPTTKTIITPLSSTTDSKATYTAIINPDSYAMGDDFFSLSVGGETLKVLAPTGSVLTSGLESGKIYTFNVTVGKTVMTINDVSVGDWTGGTLTNDKGYAKLKTN